MSSTRRNRVVVLLLVVGLGAVILSGVVASQQNSISVDGSQSIPTQTLNIDNTEYDTSSLRVAAPGDSITVRTSVSTDESYRVYIYNSNEQIVAQRLASGDAVNSFDLSGYDSGSYLLTISLDGETVAIHPLLVRGYDVSATVPDEVQRGDGLDVEASATRLRGGELDHLQFIVTNGEDRVRKNATSTNPYAATISISDLPTGEYQVYAAARGTETAFGENVFLGLNQGEQLTISESTPTPTATEPSGGGGTSGGGTSGGGGATDSGNDTATATPATTSPTPSETPTTTETTPGTDTQTPTAVTPTTVDATPTPTTVRTATPTPTPTTAPATPTATPSPTDDDVITPVSSSPTDEPGTGTDGQPGFGIALALATLVGSALLARRRSRQR
jgi:PGF-CTERM protein